MHALQIINIVITILIMGCYAYQFFVFIPVSLIGRGKRRKKAETEVVPDPRSFAVLISARNEENVIGDLIDSIKAQDYTLGPVTTIVVADNCTDRTADIAREHGAVVYTRFNDKLIGKGYALDELFGHLREDYPEGFDAYLIFDADNILSTNYITEMNKTLSEGFDVALGYRNGKNYGDNWISAGYSHWFLRDNRYLNYPRYKVGSSCVVAGTGFAFTRKVEDELGGWPFHMLTEDTEFTAYYVTSGRKIGYSPYAEFYDEQPRKFSQSWKQRLRWARGSLQVFRKYGGKMVKGWFKYGFSCFDLSMSIIPAYFLTLAAVFFNFTLGIVTAIRGEDVLGVLSSFGTLLSNLMGAVFIMGIFTTITEWKHIHTSVPKKILYLITFPFFMATYIPIVIASLFYKPKWTPITHSVTMSSLQDKKNSGLGDLVKSGENTNSQSDAYEPNG